MRCSGDALFEFVASAHGCSSILAQLIGCDRRKESLDLIIWQRAMRVRAIASRDLQQRMHTFQISVAALPAAKQILDRQHNRASSRAVRPDIPGGNICAI